MASFFQGSKTLLAIAFAVFFSSGHGHGASIIPISALVMLMSTMYVMKLCKEEAVSGRADPSTTTSMEVLDLYSESESMDQLSMSTTSREDHFSDIEWAYNINIMRERLDCWEEDWISDEESLIEIAIPTGQFVSPEKEKEKEKERGFKCCKLSQESVFMYEMMEEDNLIEIDIYMGSIK